MGMDFSRYDTPSSGVTAQSSPIGGMDFSSYQEDVGVTPKTESFLDKVLKQSSTLAGPLGWQGAYGAANVAGLGIPDIVAQKVSPGFMKPQGVGENVQRGLGDVAGFMFGAPSAIGSQVATKAGLKGMGALMTEAAAGQAAMEVPEIAFNNKNPMTAAAETVGVGLIPPVFKGASKLVGGVARGVKAIPEFMQSGKLLSKAESAFKASEEGIQSAEKKLASAFTEKEGAVERLRNLNQVQRAEMAQRGLDVDTEIARLRNEQKAIKDRYTALKTKAKAGGTVDSASAQKVQGDLEEAIRLADEKKLQSADQAKILFRQAQDELSPRYKAHIEDIENSIAESGEQITFGDLQEAVDAIGAGDEAIGQGIDDPVRQRIQNLINKNFGTLTEEGTYDLPLPDEPLSIQEWKNIKSQIFKFLSPAAKKGMKSGVDDVPLYRFLSKAHEKMFGKLPEEIQASMANADAWYRKTIQAVKDLQPVINPSKENARKKILEAVDALAKFGDKKIIRTAEGKSEYAPDWISALNDLETNLGHMPGMKKGAFLGEAAQAEREIAPTKQRLDAITKSANEELSKMQSELEQRLGIRETRELQRVESRLGEAESRKLALKQEAIDVNKVGMKSAERVKLETELAKIEGKIKSLESGELAQAKGISEMRKTDVEKYQKILRAREHLLRAIIYPTLTGLGVTGAIGYSAAKLLGHASRSHE